MTVAELLALCGSSNHDANDKDMNDLFEVLGEAHPVVAGQLVEHTRRSIDMSTGERYGTASGSEHPDWYEALRRTVEQSEDEGYEARNSTN